MNRIDLVRARRAEDAARAKGEAAERSFREASAPRAYEAPAPLQTTYLTAPSPVPPADWPLRAKAVAKLRKKAEAGVGDTIARLIGERNSALWEKAVIAITGKPCRCKGRRARLNRLFPYNQIGPL